MNSHNIQEVSKQDISINFDGEGFISQRALETLLGLSSGTISYHMRTEKTRTLKTNEINQLDEESIVFFCTYFASKNNKLAIKLSNKIMLAGVRLYIHKLAGREVVSRPKLEKKIKHLVKDNVKKDQTIRKLADATLKVAKKTKHDVLMKLVKDGFLVHDTKTITRHKYSITAKGIKAGYRSNKNGTILHPD